MKRTRKFSRKRLYMLTSAILAGLSAATSVAAAEAVPVEHVRYNGRDFADITFFKQYVGLGDENKWYVTPGTYTLSDKLMDATVDSTSYWAGLFGDGAENTAPWQIFVTTNNGQNASAQPKSLRSDGVQITEFEGQNYVLDQLQNDRTLSVLKQDALVNNIPPAGDYGYSIIKVGRYFGANRTVGDGVAEYGWWVDPDTVLPTNEQAADFAGTFRHEIGHALGVGCPREFLNWDLEPITEKQAEKQPKADGKILLRINDGVKDPNSWSLHLVDQNGNAAKEGMTVVTTRGFAALKEKYPNLTQNDVFIVDNEMTKDGKGYAYFVGNHVTEALNGAKFFGRSALPVNGWENKDFIDISHLQTAGMMSHREYSNYTSFLEVELAVLQDLGYTVDRKAYFGKSIYGNGGTITNVQGYFARNADGTAYLENTYSGVPLGIGLHIYGSGNTVTQAANILTRGTGATGVRVDGVGNTLNIPADTEIHADGPRGNGVLLAYGNNQTVNQAGTVTAGGQGGTGVRFDFGSSTNGAVDEYRGSYIRYKRDVAGMEEDDDDDDNSDKIVNLDKNSSASKTAAELGSITKAENLPLIINDLNEYNANPTELIGPMVKDYNLSGALVGSENAIYIGKNAFVRNINVNNGASIRGNITSDWKQFGVKECEGAYNANGEKIDMLRIQYNGKTGVDGYAYTDYIPDLVTRLNFNANITYTGNITGEDNMKIYVKGGTLNYGGKADVVSVTVEKGASLFGGTYALHDMMKSVAADFITKLDDTDKGTFINHGMIAPSAGSNMTIQGAFVSDGAFGLVTRSYGQQARLIDVDGDAAIGGTKLVSIEGQSYLPRQEYTFLAANNIVGTMGTQAGDCFSGFLNVNAVGTNASDYHVTLNLANNLGFLDENKTAVFNSLDEIYDVAGVEGRGRLGKLFSLNAEHGRAALTDISTGPATDASLVMRQNTVMNALTARHRYLTHQANVPVTVPMEKLVSHYAATAPKPSVSAVDPGLDMIVPVEISEGGGLWFKFTKGWGSYGDSDVTGNGFASTVGADFSISPQWKLGALFSYNNESYGGERDHRDTKDSRFGIYGDWRVGPQSAFLYLGGGWQKHDQSRHFYAGDHYNANADYNSRTIEFDGRYTYDLSYGKTGWHHKPFVSFQAVHYRQGSYTEDGAYEFGQSVDSASNTYTAAAAGWDFARDFGKNGYVEFELGVSQVLGGDSMDCKANLMGIGQKFTLRSASMDKTRFLAGIYGSQALSDRWRIGGEIGLAQGAHDRDVTASISLRYSW